MRPVALPSSDGHCANRQPRIPPGRVPDNGIPPAQGRRREFPAVSDLRSRRSANSKHCRRYQAALLISRRRAKAQKVLQSAAGNVGSFGLMMFPTRPWRNWIAHRSSEPRVTGSNPVGRVRKAIRASQLRLVCSFFSGFTGVCPVSYCFKAGYNESTCSIAEIGLPWACLGVPVRQFREAPVIGRR